MSPAPAKEQAGDDAMARARVALGGAFMAMSKSPLYAGKTIKDAFESVLPAVVCGQYRLVENDNGESVAFVSWAMVGDDALQRAEKGEPLRLSDWQSGDIGLLVDVVAATGKEATALTQEVKRRLFVNKPLKAARWQGGKRVMAEVIEATSN